MLRQPRVGRAGRSRLAAPRRTRPLSTFSLSPEAVELLERVAAVWGASKSATVERLIRQAAKREGLPGQVRQR